MKKHVAERSDAIRDRLRRQTHDAHEKLHDHSSFRALFKETLERDQYRDLMQLFHGFYVPLDQAIQRAITELSGKKDPVFTYAQRATYLNQDLVDLGVDLKTIANGARCTRLFDVVTPKTLGGVLYVIEGSTLGAAPIDRAAQKLLSPERTNGRRFWAWCRSQNKQRWAMTTSFLAEHDTSAASLDALGTGAQQTFETLADWLDPLNQSKPMHEEALL